MNSKLVLEYAFSRDDDDFGWLIAKVQTPHFSGSNGMWVQWQDVGEFAASLLRYPIDVDSPVTGEWGFREQEEYTEITKISIAATVPQMRCSPLSHLRITTSLQTDVARASRRIILLPIVFARKSNG
ncbi:hypothetical protein [Sphingobium sp. CR28]|uniref:hypothetical protein n=1 Tax=Sphingobium sp. CR28 TaxID=3400272 RepID=UPI003FEEE247